MNGDVKEIAYYILQNEYFKRRNIEIDENNLLKIAKFFPKDWFILYSLEDRIEIISEALKNNVDIEIALINKKNK